MSIALVTDSTADLTPDLIEQYQIEAIPAIIILHEEEFEDGISITREQFYAQLPFLDPPPTTATPAPGAFETTYKKLLDDGAEHILSIHVSHKLSGFYNAAQVAAQAFPGKITVIDSGQLSLGIGFQVIAAAEAIAKGADLEQALDAIEKSKENIRVVAMLDTMTQLRRSGRVSWATAGLGSLLKLKIFVEVKDGEVLRLGQARTRRNAIDRLRNMLLGFGALEKIAVLHTNALQDARDLLDSLGLTLKAPPIVINVTPAIGNHVGTNALGFAVVLRH
jgi:DegV family protein with EDD domain